MTNKRQNYFLFFFAGAVFDVFGAFLAGVFFFAGVFFAGFLAAAFFALGGVVRRGALDELRGDAFGVVAASTFGGCGVAAFNSGETTALDTIDGS